MRTNLTLKCTEGSTHVGIAYKVCAGKESLSVEFWESSDDTGMRSRDNVQVYDDLCLTGYQPCVEDLIDQLIKQELYNKYEALLPRALFLLGKVFRAKDLLK